MNDLLQTALKAHGGLDHWKKVKTIKVAASITGAIWFVKSKGDYLKDIVMTVDTAKERMITDFPGQDKRSIFQPERIVIERNDGTLIEARDNPEASFEGQSRETPWDDFHVAYFQGEALWTYLNTPFLYTHDGFTSEEISSIQVEGETWATESKLPQACEESHTGTDLLLWPRWITSPSRLHGGYSWRRHWTELCLGISRRGRHHRPEQASSVCV